MGKTSLLNALACLVVCTSMMVPWPGGAAQARQHVGMTQEEECPVTDVYFNMMSLLSNVDPEKGAIIILHSYDPSWEFCQGECQAREECTAWTYYRVHGTDPPEFICDVGFNASATFTKLNGTTGCLSSPCSTRFYCTFPQGCESSPSPCQNGGECIAEAEGSRAFRCNCSSGWEGELCEQDVNECDREPCVHSMACIDLEGDSYSCQCEDGWTGVNCDEDKDDCSPNPCVEGASCANGEPGTGEYTCTCPDGWVGPSCDEDEDDCDPNPCVRGACANGEPGTGEYLCTCPEGWTGARCDEELLRCPPLNPRNSLYRDENTCVGAIAHDVCELECEADFVSWGDNTVTSANFVCQDDGRWWPPSAEPLSCLPLCPEISELKPHSATVVHCSSRLPGSACFLTCEPGYRVVEGTIDELVCSPSGVWGSAAAAVAASQVVVVNEHNILECVVETCVTTLEFSIELFDCSFQETTYEYTNEVAYGTDKGMNVVDVNGESITTIPLTPGANTYTYDAADGLTYSFTTFMEYPSTESHLEELNLLLNLSEPFTSANYTYWALVPQWVDKVSLNPVPANLSTMRVAILANATDNIDSGSVSESDLDLQLDDVEPSSGPFVFDLPTTRDHNLLVVRVTAQDGTHSDYRVQLARQLPSTCNEQRICESLNLSECGDFCASEVSIDIDWPVLATIGGVILLMWASTAALLRQAFPKYSFASSKTLIFFTSLFDTVTDVIFLLALFSTSFTMLQYAALALVSTTFVGNIVAMVFVINKERRHNGLFAEWLRQHYTAAGVFACFSLNNCESLLLLCVGCDANLGSTSDVTLNLEVGAKTKSRSAFANVRQLFSAPLSPWAIRKLQLTSLLGLALDDIGLFAIQMAIYLLDTGVLQLGNALFVFLAINALILLMRVVVFCFRTCAARSRDARKEATAVVAAQLRAEMNDATLRNDMQTYKELAKLLECVEAGQLSDGKISDVLKTLEQKVKAAALNHDFERCIELTHHLDTLRVIAPVSLMEEESQLEQTSTIPSSTPFATHRDEVERSHVTDASRSYTPSLPPSPQMSRSGPTTTASASPAAPPLPPRSKQHEVSLSTGRSPPARPCARTSYAAPPKRPAAELRVPLRSPPRRHSGPSPTPTANPAVPNLPSSRPRPGPRQSVVARSESPLAFNLIKGQTVNSLTPARSPPRRHSGPMPSSVTTSREQQQPHRRSQGGGGQHSRSAAPAVGDLLHQHLVRAFDRAREESNANASRAADGK